MFNSCAKCWENPCRCGEEYKHMSVQQIEDLIRVLEQALKDKLYQEYKNSQSWDGPGNR